MKNCVFISSNDEEIIIKIDDKAEFKDVLDSVKKKMSEIKKIYKAQKSPFSIEGKLFSDMEKSKIEEIIKDGIEDATIEFENPRMLGLHGIKKSFNKEIAVSETKFHRGSLRSGQKIEFEGSIVVLGDVNGGAEVIAGENIVVLGFLRGLAHAGAKGNREAIIAAAAIESPQLRISNIIKEIEKNQDLGRKIKTSAYVNDRGEMVLE